MPRWDFLILGMVSMSVMAAPTSMPSPTTMPASDLTALDRKELGAEFDASLADKYLAAHQAIEKFFIATRTDDRKAALTAIEQLRLDANIVGRLTRIHADWPALPPGVYVVEDRVGPHKVSYLLGVPKSYERTRAFPLVVDLIASPDESHMAAAQARWANAIVLMPIPDPLEGFGPSYGGMSRVIYSMRHAMSRVNIDPARVTLVGQENAAPDVWNIGLLYPTYFAAIEPFAGSANAEWQRLRMMNLRNTAVIAWHDANDPVLKVDNTRLLTDILSRFKYDVFLLQTKAGTHAPNADIIRQCDEQAASRVRSLYPKQVAIQSNRPDTEFNRVDWVQMYQATRPGEDHLVFFRHGGTLTVNENTMSIKATIANNKIEVETDNVESMRFYVNDQMVDFSKPVTVIVNGHVKFQGVLKPSVEEMLKDQLFLGRGWRYFTGMVDVDFGAPATQPR